MNLDNKKVYIAGAHSRGITMGYYLQYLYPELEIEAYLYNNDEINPSDVNGVPVLKISADSKLDTELPVYLGMRGVNHYAIIETLIACGVEKIIPVDVNLDLEIRNQFLKKYYFDVGRVYTKIDDYVIPKDLKTREYDKAKVYVACSVFDKALQTPYGLGDYEKKIQVGTALTDVRLDNAVYDNEGENISDRNKQYCELTGLYWVWKHATEDYVGLCHYRRHFLLPDNWNSYMEKNDIDVILPVPLYVFPNLADNFRGRHAAKEWDCMMHYLKGHLPTDYENATDFFKGNLYSPCNMLIAKREVLDQLCTWMFPILDAVVDICGMEEQAYNNRYPGFLSERLITYFFETKRDCYKVVYADKNFLP